MCVFRKGASTSTRVVDVWAHNLEEEFEKMIKVLEQGQCQYIAMDTEFPGIVINNPGSKRYDELKCNVNAMRLIQLGLTFSNVNGDCTSDVGCWQFNFDFDVHQDLHSAESIELLHRAGLDFRKHKEGGVDPHRFGELLMQSGLVLSDQVHWICFHGCYDFAYLIKVLTGGDVPGTRKELLELIDLFFPKRADVKLCAKTQGNFGSLASIAEQRGLATSGLHQGGFDAMLTRDVFFSLPDSVRETAFSGELFGLGEDAELCGEAPEARATKTAEADAAATAQTFATDWREASPQHHQWGGQAAPQRFDEPVPFDLHNGRQNDYQYPHPPREDYRRNGYGGRNDWGRNDYGRNDYGRNDYGRNDYRRNDYGRNDYRNDYGRNGYGGDYGRPDYLQSGPGDHLYNHAGPRYPNWGGDYQRQAVF